MDRASGSSSSKELFVLRGWLSEPPTSCTVCGAVVIVFP